MNRRKFFSGLAAAPVAALTIPFIDDARSEEQRLKDENPLYSVTTRFPELRHMGDLPSEPVAMCVYHDTIFVACKHGELIQVAPNDEQYRWVRVLKCE